MEWLINSSFMSLTLTYEEVIGLKGCGLEEEVLLVQNKEPFNLPSGKIGTLCLKRGSEKFISYQFLPKQDWERAEEIRMTINDSAYSALKESGRIGSVPPTTFYDIIIQQKNAGPVKTIYN